MKLNRVPHPLRLIGLILLLPLGCDAKTTDSPSNEPLVQEDQQPSEPINEPLVQEDQQPPEPSHEEIEPEYPLAQHGPDGRIIDHGPEPDILAMNYIELTAEQRQAAHVLLTDRYRVLDALVRQHLDAIEAYVRLPDDVAAAERIERLQDLRRLFRPFIERGPFFQEIEETLTPVQQHYVRAMLTEYQILLIGSMADGVHDMVELNEFLNLYRLETFAELLRQSVERQWTLSEGQLERLTVELELEASQQIQMEDVFRMLFLHQLRGEGHPRDQAEAFRIFRRRLSAEQDQALILLMIDDLKAAIASSEPDQDQRSTDDEAESDRTGDSEQPR